jgi:cytochrome P450
MKTQDEVVGSGKCPIEHSAFSFKASTFTDPAIQRRPNEFYRALRKESPVHFDETLGMYLVSRYEDLDAVFRDPVTYSQEKGYYSLMAHVYLDELKSLLRQDGGGWFPDAVNVDPPRHGRVRALTQQAFTAHRMKSLEAQFEQLVDELIDRVIDKGEMDGLKDLALPMAIGFSTGQLNVSDLEQDVIRRWGAAYLAQFSLLQSREHMLKTARELCDLQNYLIALVNKRMKNPEEDMLSDLIRARIDDDNPKLSFEELVAMARAILINTHDSVSTALVNILFATATASDVANEFYAAADDDRRMGRLVEELLRLEPPVRAMSRMTTKAVELGGIMLPERAHLLLLFASGNDDEAVFQQPREFDVERKNLNRSMTFGAGVHLCLGISLARMQLRVAARKVAQRLKNLRLTVPAEEIQYNSNVALLAMESLPLGFTASK